MSTARAEVGGATRRWGARRAGVWRAATPPAIVVFSFLALSFLILSFLAPARLVADVGYRPIEWRSVNLQGMGWVTGMAIHPSEADLIYVRTDVGGVFRYRPQDESWVPLMDRAGLGLQQPVMPTLDVESLALDPEDSDVVYVALGDDAVDVESPVGDLYRSADRGATWRVLGLRRADGKRVRMAGNGDHRQAGERLAVDPNDPQVIYFGSRADGLFRSVDGGDSWAEVAVPERGDSYVGITFVAIDPTSGSPGSGSSRIVYGAANGGLVVSTNGGVTWNVVAGVGGGIPYWSSYASTGDLYVTFRDPFDVGAANGGLWKYDKAADSWADVSPSDDGYTGVSAYWRDPNRIAVKRARLGFGRPTDLDVSSDGGDSWQSVARRLVTPAYYPADERAGRELETGALYFDPHVIGRLWWLDGYGVYRNDRITDDPGTYRTVMQNLEQLVVNQVRGHPSGRLLVAAWDMAGFAIDEVEEVPSERVTEAFGRGTSFAFSPADPDTIYWVGAVQFERRPLARVSTDGGVTWGDLPSLPRDFGFGDGQIAVSATDPLNVVWTSPLFWPAFPFDSETWSSRDGGASWVLSRGLPTAIRSNGPHNGINLAADGADARTFYLFSCGPEDDFLGTLYRSVDGGASFHVRARGGVLGCDDEVNLRAEPELSGVLWLTSRADDGTPGRLRKSDDGGASWVEVASVERAAFFDFGPPGSGHANPTVWIYGVVDGIEGVWVSLDAAAATPGDLTVRWSKVNDPTRGFSNITSLAADPIRLGRVYVGTAGRGVFYGHR